MKRGMLISDGMGCASADHPYSLGRYSGMLAYAVDRTGDEWGVALNEAVSNEFGESASMFLVGGVEHAVSIHQLPKGARPWDHTKVVHMALPFETRPGSR